MHLWGCHKSEFFVLYDDNKVLEIDTAANLRTEQRRPDALKDFNEFKQDF